MADMDKIKYHNVLRNVARITFGDVTKKENKRICAEN